MLGIGAVGVSVSGCGDEPKTPAETKPAEPAVPDEIQNAANAFLGKETTVLAFGDLAKNGKQQFLAANVVPKTPKTTEPGTVVTRAVIAESDGGKWNEVFRCDEHLKNAEGYLALTPLVGVTGWRLQFEQDPDKGLAMYFTAIHGTGAEHVLPIGVRWNPAKQRYQSLDRNYEHFLSEASSLTGAAPSRLR